MQIDLVDMNKMDVNQEDDMDFSEWAVDDISGKWLDRRMVKDARHEEIGFMDDIGVFEESSEEECIRLTGAPHVSTKWVDTDKGGPEDPLIRSRLVARGFKTKGDNDRSDLFAAMPPLEAKRLLFRMAMTRRFDQRTHKEKKDVVKLMFIDVKKAHLNGKVKEDEFVFVRLPVEAGGRSCEVETMALWNETGG